MNTFKIAIGDPSDDGHGKVEWVKVICNKTTEDIKNAYVKSCELTGLVFTSNTDVTVNGEKLNWQHPEYNDRQICVDYESYYPSDLAWEILSNYNIEKEEDFDVDCMCSLFMDFIKISLPDLEYQEVKGTEEILGITLGYGLFE